MLPHVLQWHSEEYQQGRCLWSDRRRRVRAYDVKIPSEKIINSGQRCILIEGPLSHIIGRNQILMSCRGKFVYGDLSSVVSLRSQGVNNPFYTSAGFLPSKSDSNVFVVHSVSCADRVECHRYRRLNSAETTFPWPTGTNSWFRSRIVCIRH